MDKKDFALGKTNFIMMAIGVIVVFIGFILMSGGSSTENFFNPDIFSFRHLTLAPIVTFIGFISIIWAILFQPKEDKEKKNNSPQKDN